MKHLIDAKQLTAEYIQKLVTIANQIYCSPKFYQNACRGKILASLFYEASTRTRLSFESAMISLGGGVIGFSSAEVSSASKGESVADTIRAIASYADICAIRHYKEGAALVASQNSKIPVINAGDGGHQHPTQTLADVYTIHNAKKSLDNFTIGVCGDLKFGRTAHSFIKTMAQYPNNRFLFISPNELKIPGYLYDFLKRENIEMIEYEELEKNIPEMDILYMTRVQKERFFNEADYIRLKDFYILNQSKLAHAKPDLMIMHPLPRVNEISSDVDNDKRAYYFEQVKMGKYIRMALLLDLLEVEECLD